MKVKPFVDQLAGLGFVDTGGPIEYAALTAVPRMPAGFVVPTEEQAGANTMNGIVGASDQRVEFGFAVNVVLAGAARSTGALSEKLEEMTGAVKSRLNGWVHPEAVAAVEYAGGNLIRVDGVLLIWAVRFRTAYRLRKVG